VLDEPCQVLDRRLERSAQGVPVEVDQRRLRTHEHAAIALQGVVHQLSSTSPRGTTTAALKPPSSGTNVTTSSGLGVGQSLVSAAKIADSSRPASASRPSSRRFSPTGRGPLPRSVP